MRLRRQRDDGPSECENDRQHPVPHHDFRAGPPQRFEMMMQGSDAEQFSTEEFLGNDLRDIRGDGRDQKRADDRQYADANASSEVVRHERDRRDGERERHCAGVRHVKPGRRYVEPEESKNAADDGGGKCCEVYLLLCERDDRIRGENAAEYAAREAVDTVDDARSIERKRYENEKRNDEPADLKRIGKRDVHCRNVKLVEEPPADRRSERDDDNKAIAERQPFPAGPDDQKVVDETHERADQECRERYPRLITAQEIKFEYLGARHEFCDDSNADDGYQYAPPDDDAAHTRRTHFLLHMQAVEFERLRAVERALSGLFFPRPEGIEVVSDYRRDGHSDDESCRGRNEDPYDIGQHTDIVPCPRGLRMSFNGGFRKRVR